MKEDQHIEWKETWRDGHLRWVESRCSTETRRPRTDPFDWVSDWVGDWVADPVECVSNRKAAS